MITYWFQKNTMTYSIQHKKLSIFIQHTILSSIPILMSNHTPPHYTPDLTSTISGKKNPTNLKKSRTQKTPPEKATKTFERRNTVMKDGRRA